MRVEQSRADRIRCIACLASPHIGIRIRCRYMETSQVGQRGRVDKFRDAVAAIRQVSEGWTWWCYRGVRARELGSGVDIHERMPLMVSGQAPFSFRSHSKSLFCLPFYSALPLLFCISPLPPPSLSRISIAAVQHPVVCTASFLWQCC
jgi:hypothetical protein